MNAVDAMRACTLGSRISASIPRDQANALLVEIRRTYGPLGGFSNTYLGGVTHLAFERNLPHISDLLLNDNRFNTVVTHDGHIFLSNR